MIIDEQMRGIKEADLLTFEIDSGHKNKNIGFIRSLCDHFQGFYAL